MCAVACQLLLFIFLVGMAGLAPARAAISAHVTVILVEHLALSDISRTTLPHIARLRDKGALAMVSPGSPRPPDPLANAYATFSAGDVINTKNPHNGLLQHALVASGADGRVKLIVMGTVRRRMHMLDALVAEQMAALGPEGKLMLCSVVPPQDADDNWDQLTVVMVSGLTPAIATLVSDTTHTTGLIALRDIAPTILSWVNVPIPGSMSGAPARAVAVDDRSRLLAHLDRLTELNQHILLPLAWFLGGFGGVALLGTIYVLARKKRLWPGGLRYLLRAVIAFPLASLLAPVGNPQTVVVYAAIIIAFDLLLALIPSAGALCVLTAGLLVADGLSGARLIAQTALSGYWLPGIRFYGIGNEYMGVLLGMALMGAVLLLPQPSAPLAQRAEDGLAADPPLLSPSSTGTARGRRRSNGVWIARTLLACWFGLVIFTLSFPQFGAKAGGALTAMVCFAPAWFALALGRRIGWLSFALSALAGFVLVFFWAWLAHALALRETHIQAAATAVEGGRFGYIGHVALRKAKMAVRIFLHPGVILTLAGLVLTYSIWRRSSLPEEMRVFLRNRPSLAIALRAGGWGILAAILFNDSGTVAAFFLFGALAITFLHEMLSGPVGDPPRPSATPPEAGGGRVAVETQAPLGERKAGR